jgi:tetratricopeptide (TPR) repeat protein
MPLQPRYSSHLSLCALVLLGAAQPQSSIVASGDALFAQGRLAEAAAVYQRAVALEPKSAALAALSRIRLYQHREREAEDLARKALALAPDNVLATQVLRSTDARQKAFAPDVERISGRARQVSVPFVVTDPLPVVRLTIGGRDANFLLDTGAPNVALSRSFATSLALPITQGGVGTFAGGQHARVDLTIVPELEIGGIRVSNVPAMINPAELQLPGVRTDGVIGTVFLMHFLSTIDYCQGALVLAPRSSSAAFERRSAASHANIVPMWLVGDHFLFARGAINRAEGLFSIDTGLAGGGLVATKQTIDAAGIKLDAGKAQVGQGGGGQVPFQTFKADATMGKLARKDVPGVFMTGGDPYGIFPFKVSGALSHDFFRRSRLTFDFDSMKLITQQC